MRTKGSCINKLCAMLLDIRDMNKYIDKETNLKLKIFSFYQIIGGLIGIGLVTFSLTNVVATNNLLIIAIIIFIILFGFSIFCGLQVLKGDLTRALKLSTINQLLQVFTFSLLGFSFKYVAGLLLSLGLDLTDGFNITFNFSMSAFQADLNADNENLQIGFNLISIFLVIYIEKLQKKIELKKELQDSLEKTLTEKSSTTHNTG